ncbi:MAG: DUF504 domain-containing protein [Candidatus Woesearchaeota archaeon]|nr:DUF504 domain-containing protein [Candidatus Woesearchaeota archaeon]
MNIKDIINKMLWDRKERKEDYSFYYIDRITKKDVEINGGDILRLDGSFIVVKKNDEEIEIPIHRIRAAKKGNKIIFLRKQK